MRWLALLVVVLAGTADAKMIKPMSPRNPGELCGNKPTWDKVMTCLQGHGTTTLERVLPAARLVRVVQGKGERSDAHELYLYVRRDDRAWEFAGTAPALSMTVLGFAPHTIGEHGGYRLSLGQLDVKGVFLAGKGRIPVIVAEQHSVFCSGPGDDCAMATTHCDVIYRGKALWTFRGTLAFENGAIVDAGDRSHGGPECQPEERIPLVWSSK